ncbi:NAD(P)-binding domain-containing protein [Denitrobaculum tricleocarpae]|uniref:Pyridine nucleotide-disulfide oxidoreductase n=1 Tax=Denitrobaculum tricleocarpae TaxID=2591009 RepID=A0A545TN15_9PROT|nr:NAD(P)-binding domain-containing protein [Denitrobaculum tricleocarpae]TQV78625.1 pyridine nucleotide-disulfide oxidoreductase [Denitrobaculum tricleocarpae]
MTHATAIIIGAGHAGLAMSRALTRRSIDHVVLDRGGPGDSWHKERWDSLHMITPNWANGLPGAPYKGPDPDGYMSAREFADSLERYAKAISAPLRSGVTVTRLSSEARCFRIETGQDLFTAETVVNATGATRRPRVPALSRDVPKNVLQITTDRYRNPAALPPGTVLVVGASASGVQIARELQLSGRQVVLAVGGHLRLPRHYRGRDIDHWLDVCGISDERAVEIEDLSRARRLPSAQLFSAGPVDLNALQELGVEVVGRLSAIRNGKALFSGGLASLVTAADLKMNRTLRRIDEWLDRLASPGEIAAPDQPEPTAIAAAPRLSLDLSGSLRTIVWATGYTPDHTWIDAPVFDARGRLRHDGGVCPVPGLYMLGLPILRRRRSHQISGAAADTHDLSILIGQHLDACRAA